MLFTANTPDLCRSYITTFAPLSLHCPSEISGFRKSRDTKGNPPHTNPPAQMHQHVFIIIFIYSFLKLKI